MARRRGLRAGRWSVTKPGGDTATPNLLDWQSLSLSRSHGLFYFDRAAGSEVRLFHKDDFHPRGLFVDAERRVHTTRTNADHSVHIMRIDDDGKNTKILTGGDCADENPYVRDGKLYYQSAGIGRNEQGVAIAWSPIAVHRIDWPPAT